MGSGISVLRDGTMVDASGMQLSKERIAFLIQNMPPDKYEEWSEKYRKSPYVIPGIYDIWKQQLGRK
jgi:hypothetical protein